MAATVARLERCLRDVSHWMSANRLVSGEENPKIAPSPWDYVTLLEEDRSMAIGNIHKKIG